MKKFIILPLFLIILLISTSLNAASTNKDVEIFIENMTKNSKKILNNIKLTDQQKNIEYKQFTDSIIDSNWVARFILGSYWKELTPTQREEFHKLYKEYLLENYMPKLQDFNKELSISKISKQKENVFMVSTNTKDINNRNINVDFRIIERNNQLYLTDIIPEGISFISSQRTDINSSISQNGYEKFIKDLKNKINNE